MIYVDDTACNGCAECVDVCPTGALIFQNNHAFIDQELCKECEVCIDACPQGAILSEEVLPVSWEVIHVPEAPPTNPTSGLDLSERVPIRDMVLPVVASVLLWTGRELVPRLADMALGVLDRCIHSPQFAPNRIPGMRYNSPVSIATRQRKRRLRRQHHRKK